MLTTGIGAGSLWRNLIRSTASSTITLEFSFSPLPGIISFSEAISSSFCQSSKFGGSTSRPSSCKDTDAVGIDSICTISVAECSTSLLKMQELIHFFV